MPLAAAAPALLAVQPGVLVNDVQTGWNPTIVERIERPARLLKSRPSCAIAPAAARSFRSARAATPPEASSSQPLPSSSICAR